MIFKTLGVRQGGAATPRMVGYEGAEPPGRSSLPGQSLRQHHGQQWRERRKAGERGTERGGLRASAAFPFREDARRSLHNPSQQAEQTPGPLSGWGLPSRGPCAGGGPGGAARCPDGQSPSAPCPVARTARTAAAFFLFLSVSHFSCFHFFIFLHVPFRLPVHRAEARLSCG